MENKDKNQAIIINLNPRFIRFFGKLGLLLLVIFLFFLILPYSSTVLTPLIISILFSFLLDPVVIFLQRNGFHRTGAVILIMAFFILVIALLVIGLSPLISEEYNRISQTMNSQNPAEMFSRFSNILMRQVPFLDNKEIASKVTDKLEQVSYDLLDKSIKIIPNIFSVVIMIILIPFMTFFLLKDAPRIKKSLIQIVPNRYFEMSLILLHKISHQLGSYIRGQLVVSLLIGTLSVTALYILDVPYFFFIGIMAGLANMIPYFGPIAGAVPAVILNFIDKGTFAAALVVVIAFAVIRLIDDTIISPNILARSVEIHPLMVILVIFIGGDMFGLLGLLLCIPVTGIIKVTVQELLWSFKNYRLFG